LARPELVTTPSIGWLRPLDTPPPQPRLFIGDVQAIGWTPLAVVIVIPPIGWFMPLQEPPKPLAPLLPGVQQFAAPSPFPVVPFAWYNALGEPVRAPPKVTIGQIQALARPEKVTAPTGWFAALSEPVRAKSSLLVAQQQTLAMPPRLVTPSMGWFRPLNEPVRFPPALISVLRWATQNFPAQPPIVNMTPAALAAIEQGDQASFAISVYHTPTSVIIGVHLVGS
jgi:hypothetical protein